MTEQVTATHASDLLGIALRLVGAIESMPADHPDLGAVLGEIEHAVERRQQEIARRVIERAKALARAGRPGRERQ